MKAGFLSQGGSGRGLAAPVGPSGFLTGISLFRIGPLRVPRLALRPATVPWRDPNSPPCGFEIRLPIGRPMKRSFSGRPFAKPSTRGLPVSPDPRRKVGSALACAAASRFFLPVARDHASIGFHPCGCPPLSAGPQLGASIRCRKAAPCHRRSSGILFRVAPSVILAIRPVDNGDNGDKPRLKRHSPPAPFAKAGHEATCAIKGLPIGQARTAPPTPIQAL